MSNSTPLRFAILGTSGHANRIAVHILKQIPGVSLIGAAGSAPGKGTRFAEQHTLARGYQSFEELLADSQVDAVWLCSPNHMHARHVAQCAAAGKHILVEKPLATTRSDAEAVAEAVAKAKVTLRVGCQHRFRPSHGRLRELVRSGVVGQIGYFRIHRFWRYPYYEDMDRAGPATWRQSPTESGGWVINDLGSHLLDLMLWISGAEGQTAGAVLASQQFATSTEDSTAVLVQLDKAGIGIMETSCANDSPGSRIEIYGDTGWIRAENTLTGAATILTHDGQSHVFAPVEVMHIYRDEVRDFIAAIRGQPNIGADVMAGAAVAGLIESATATGVRARAVPAG
jgi:predicted dehydrogenase